MPDPADIEAAMLGLLGRRAPDASICPSEVARALQPDGWRAHARGSGGRGATGVAGLLRVTRGAVEVPAVDVADAAGPIPLRSGPPAAAGAERPGHEATCEAGAPEQRG